MKRMQMKTIYRKHPELEYITTIDQFVNRQNFRCGTIKISVDYVVTELFEELYSLLSRSTNKPSQYDLMIINNIKDNLKYQPEYINRQKYYDAILKVYRDRKV